MTGKELYQEMESYRKIFDVVRLVDVTDTQIITVSEKGELSSDGSKCYAIWNKNRRCENCISAQAYATKGELTKFEFSDHHVYFIISKYINIEGIDFVLEFGKFITDKTLFGAHGKENFINKITAYNTKIYTDSLTGCYNRRYFDEQLSGLQNIKAIAVLDIDNFKQVNDIYGHDVGDAILKAFSTVLLDNVRNQDNVIRFGGDEFLLIFQEMSQDLLYPKLNTIRAELESLQIAAQPEIHITASIGGCYCKKYSNAIFKKADQLLYEAKKERNKVVTA